ncbi:MAG TPA: glycosyl hydrolase, partial [Chthoniobacteraceae bacterium]|nr:glycosyl hydrolase [Chthoniobacteraceae bacterium]
MNLKYYRDIAVIAFPNAPIETVRISDFNPTITSSEPGFDGRKIIDGDPTTTAVLPLPSPVKPVYVQFEFSQPYQVRNLTITPGPGGIYSATGKLERSDDGIHFSNVRGFRVEAGSDPQGWTVRPTLSRFYRVVFDKPPLGLNGNPPPQNITLGEVSLGPSLVIDNLPGKTALIRPVGTIPPPPPPAPAGDLAIDSTKTIDISGHMTPDGQLTWEAPAGDWTIIRFGYTTTGKMNSPSTAEARGLESDKLSAAATDLLWSGLTAKIIARAGALTGQTITASWVDSWEAESQNWTPNFREEFLKRRGYDMTPYFPALAGHVVDSQNKTERFLWDFRRTVADLLSDNFFSRLAQLAHQAGMKLTTEPYGNGPFEDLSVARNADLIRGEFWPSHDMDFDYPPKLAASISHTYGKPIIGMESFTDSVGRWQQSPEKLKPLGDLVYTLGCNQFTLHEYSHSPWLNVVPGMTLGQFGTNFNRGITWSEQMVAWIHYLTRCQYLLQQGLCVADFLYFNGEAVPGNIGLPLFRGRRTGPMMPPGGYENDDCSEDVILNRLSVKNGRLTLPDGMSYRALILPAASTASPELLRKLTLLAAGGATIIGPRPSGPPGLTNYPQCDAEVKKLCDSLWSSGKIADPPSLEEVIKRLSLEPDFQYTDKGAALLYTHRSAPGMDIYFISNQNGDYESTDCLFRVHGKTPEIWHPDTGVIEQAPIYSEEGDRTRIPLRLDPSGSLFVVFRDSKTKPANHAVALSRLDPPPPTAGGNLAVMKATYEGVGKTSGIDVTAQVLPFVHDGGLSMTADPSWFDKDPAHNQERELRVEYVYNGQPGVATVRDRERITIGAATPSTQFPDARLKSEPGAPLKIEAWQNGTYQVSTAAGSNIKTSIANVSPPMAVPGPWELTFPPHWGAPDKITLDHLISWSDSPEDGVKYFSGTATYRKTLTIPTAVQGPGRHLYLDLGDVKVIAQVFVNGQDLGILWKNPFYVDISGAVKPGDNLIEIKVTNLWPNRIIGDEHLPPDCKWAVHCLVAWPDWLLQNKPNPTGRFTLEDWHNWTKDDALLQSGLIGPVRLVPSVESTVAK